jgi:tetratricopeptide (TPR) repeat protein
MKKTSCIPSAFLAVLVITAAPTLKADPAAAETAKAHAERGMVSYNLSDWPAAIGEFRAAFQADPRPEYLFSKAQAERLGGEYTAAILSFKAFLRTSGSSSARVAATEALIAECQAKLEEEAVRKDREAVLATAQASAAKRQANLPPPENEPPPKTVVATATGHRGIDSAGLLLTISGIGFAAAGTGFFLWGNTEMHQAAGRSTYQQYESDVSGAKTKRMLGIVGMGLGAGLLTWEIVRFAIVDTSTSGDKAVAARLAVSPSGVLVQGRF